MRRFFLFSFAALLAASSLAHAAPPGRARVRAGAALSRALEGAIVHPLADREGRVPVTVRLAPGEDASSLGLLEVAPGVGARWVERSMLGSFVEQHTARRPWVSPPLHPVMDKAGKLWTKAQIAHADGKTGKGAAVGIIDTGLDVAHPDLRSPDGKTRVAWLLDLASSPKGLHPDLEKKFGCLEADQPSCAVYSSADIDEVLAASGTSINDQVGHGTHVASIAAGNGGKTGQYVGVAPEASLVAVRVTRQSAGESITDVDILNAVRFVFDRAEAMGMPAVVNVSLGGDYGPHDGTSPLEAGLASFVGPGHPGRAIVVAAGNSAGIVKAKSGDEYGAHTEARILPKSTTRVVLTTPAAEQKVNGSAYVWVTLQHGDDVSVGLERNGEEVIHPLAPGEQGAVSEKQGEAPYMAVINGVVGENSPLTGGSTGAVLAISGDFDASDRFAITLEGEGTAQLWVQGTGDAEYGSAVGGSLFLRPLKQGTINVPATHPDLIAVGCTINRTSWTDVKGEAIAVKSVGSLVDPPGDSACYFSGAGPNALGASKPEIAAPGGFVAAALSSAADPKTNPRSMFVAPPERCASPADCYVVDEQHAVASGTSMSAPQVTGAAALLLAERPDLTQQDLVALLQAGARAFEGVVPLEYQVGPGALDVVGSLKTLAELSSPRGMAPDATKSWMHASSGFVRPDGASPVVVTVLLRAADGGPASAADASKIRVSASNGEVTQPPAPLPGRGVPGAYRFQVVAPPGTGGQSLDLAVSYDGAEIGRRSLPIGADLWATRGAPVPKGGCSAAAPGEGGRAGGREAAAGGLLAAGLGALLVFTRRTRGASRRAARRGPRRSCRGDRG